MAVAPLFNSSIDTLKATLRLSGASQTDTLAMINQAVQEVRVGFYDRLGSDRVAEILSFAAEDNPSTSGPLMRIKANYTEAAWVKMLLIDRLPYLFLDDSSQTDQIFNEEGLTRGVSASELRRMRQSLAEDVETGIVELIKEERVSPGNVYVPEPSKTPPRPGETLFPKSGVYY
jgi:hypothetical protein